MHETEQYVETCYGSVLVSIYGDRKKLPIVTFHDIGLNAQDNFGHFFKHDTGNIFNQAFCIYNINAPGQELNAKPFASDYRFPSVDDLVKLIEDVVDYFNLKNFVGLGVGAGAHLMLRYGIRNPNEMAALILINCVETTTGWIEWTQEKLNVELLKDIGMTKFTENYLLWHHLGHHLYVCPREEIDEFRVYFEDRPNPVNVAAFIDSYLNRSDIEINKHPCKVPVLQIVGERSAFVQDAEDLHMKLSPMATEFLKLSGCGGNVLNEKPAKVTEALLLFLQGVGLVPWLDVHESVKKISEKFVQKSSL